MARRGPALPPTVLAVGVPTAAFVATAAPAAQWLDTGTFVAQAVDFGVAHPPGHPLAGLVGTAASLLPLGPLSFRVALISVICAGLAAFFLHRSTWSTLRAIGVAPRIVDPLAVATVWWVAGSYGWWMQAVRPEVYALQAMLGMGILDRLIAFEVSWPDAPDTRPLLVGGLLLGLGLANHHLLALLLLPAAAGTLARALRAHGVGALGRATGACVLGVATYIYLPLRALAKPLSNLGDPVTFERFWWVVSAEVFQKNQGAGVPDPLPLRLADCIVSLTDSLHWAVFLLALGGAYVVLRVEGSRRIGAIWVMVLGVFVAARAWLGFVSGNPDALGYLMPALAATGVLAASLIATLLQLVPLKAAKLTTALAVLLAVASGWQFVRSGPQSSMAASFDAALMDGAVFRDLPVRGVLISHAPQTAFRVAGLRAEEVARPDLTIVPVPMLAYPGEVERLLEAEPDLRDLLRGSLVTGRLREADAQSLSLRRSLLVEMDPRVPLTMYPSLVPEGIYHRVVPGGATRADSYEAADRQRKVWGGLLRRLRWPEGPDRETRAQVLWRRAQDALYLASVGQREEARVAVRTALEASPGERSMEALAAALEMPNDDGIVEGPVDVSPFMQPVD